MRYQLRYAAGRYWILDYGQDGVPYRRPLTTNEVGARIWRLTQQGLSDERIAEELSAGYRVSKDEIAADIRQFRRQLAECGIEDV